MNLSDYIDQYEEVEDCQLSGNPAFLARLNIARKLKNEAVYQTEGRGLESPFYLTDLGVRKSGSPKLYAELITQELGTRLPDRAEVLKELKTVPLERLVAWFDVTMLLLGDYELIAEVVLERRTSILASKDFRLVLFSGTALAAVQDEGYHSFFRAIENFSGLEQEEKYILEHRLAAAELKRSHNYERFNEILAGLLAKYDMDKPEDFLVILGLLGNLSGLEQKKKNYSDVLLLLTMINADVILNLALTNETDLVRKDMILRYLGQVAINRGQLAVFAGDFDKAISIMKSSLSRNLKNNSEYVGESYGILAAMEYSAGFHADAREHAEKAIEFFKKFGDIVALQQSYKVLLCSLDSLGEKNKAELLAEKLKNNDRKILL